MQILKASWATKGGARWNYLAAWAYALNRPGGDERGVRLVTRLYRNAGVLDSGARRGHDELRAARDRRRAHRWENEAFLVQKEFGADKSDIVAPSASILAEPPVSVVDRVVEQRGTRKLAEAYLRFLYSEDGQLIAACNFYRPRSAKVPAELSAKFPKLKLYTVDATFGGWANAQKTHFADGGVFDVIYQPH